MAKPELIGTEKPHRAAGDALRRAEPRQKDIESLYPNFPKPKQTEEFFAAVGCAIVAWQLVETGLYEVYRATSSANRPGAEAAAFYSMNAFRTKLSFTGAAFQFAFIDDESRLKAWRKIAAKAQDKYKWRNQMAHGCIYTLFNEVRHDRKIYIGPDVNDPRSNGDPRQPNHDHEPLTLQRVRGYEKDFRSLGLALLRFARSIPPP